MMRRMFARFVRVCTAVVASVDRSDVALVAGLSLVAYGVSRWSEGLACLTVGALLLRLAWPPPAPPANPSAGRML